MATRKKKAASAEPAKKLTRSEMKQKIRELKKKRSDAGDHAASEELRVWRRKLRKAARHKQA